MSNPSSSLLFGSQVYRFTDLPSAFEFVQTTLCNTPHFIFDDENGDGFMITPLKLGMHLKDSGFIPISSPSLPSPQTKTDAQKSMSAETEKALRLLESLRLSILRVDAQMQTSSPRSWSFVGSMSHISASLKRAQGHLDSIK